MRNALGGDVVPARALLHKRVSEKLAFLPDLETRVCAFTGRGSVERSYRDWCQLKGGVPKGNRYTTEQPLKFRIDLLVEAA